MTFALIAAGAVLASGGLSVKPKVAHPVLCERVYQFMIVPGGGVCSIPMPYVVMLPLGQLNGLHVPLPPKFRTEFKVVIQAEQELAVAQTVAKAFMDEMKNAKFPGSKAEFSISMAEKVASGVCVQRNADPKQVIDPIVTGY